MMSARNLQRQIHAACRDMGIGEEMRRDIQMAACGKASMRDMTTRDLHLVVDHLKSRGWDAQALSRQKKTALSGPYAKKCQALWIAAYNLGLVESRHDAALTAFVTRQTGIEDMRWLRDAQDAARVVEALKSWIAREGGVVWDQDFGREWLAHGAAKIAWAIWCKLTPRTSLDDTGGFENMVREVGEAPKPLAALTSREWQEVCNILGAQLRATK